MLDSRGSLCPLAFSNSHYLVKMGKNHRALAFSLSATCCHPQRNPSVQLRRRPGEVRKEFAQGGAGAGSCEEIIALDLRAASDFEIEQLAYTNIRRQFHSHWRGVGLPGDDVFFKRNAFSQSFERNSYWAVIIVPLGGNLDFKPTAAWGLDFLGVHAQRETGTVRLDVDAVKEFRAAQLRCFL